nr:hypothetical protein [Klebsiella quasipneumoniae]
MTDITELALRLKLEAHRAVSNFNPQMNIKTRDLKELLEALEKAQQRIVELQQGCENDPRIHEIIDLKERIDNLESFRTAYMEWGEKTDWVQTDKRFDVLKPLGKHRADVLKEYIQHLESRTVTVKLPDLRQIVSGDRYVWSDGVYNYSQDVKVALAAAGIKVEAE